MKKKNALAGFSKFDTVPVSKLEWEGDLLLILRVINFSCFSSQWFRRANLVPRVFSREKTLGTRLFVELDKVQVNIQEVKHDLRQIEQIDSRLYNNEDTQRVLQELGSKYTNKQQLRKLCFFKTGLLHEI